MLPLVFGMISATLFGIASIYLYGIEGLLEYGYIFFGLIFLGLIISFLDEANQCLACRVKDKYFAKDIFGSLCEKRHCFS
jgi:hypothetical protein